MFVKRAWAIQNFTAAEQKKTERLKIPQLITTYDCTQKPISTMKVDLSTLVFMENEENHLENRDFISNGLASMKFLFFRQEQVRSLPSCILQCA